MIEKVNVSEYKIIGTKDRLVRCTTNEWVKIDGKGFVLEYIPNWICKALEDGDIETINYYTLED